MNIPINAIYQADCLALLERIESEQITLVYIDPPMYSDTERSMLADVEDNGSMKHLRFLSIVLQQSQRVLSKSGNLFFHSEPHLTSLIRPILNEIFGEENLRAEFIWPRHRISPINKSSAGPQITHATIFYYSNTYEYVYNKQFDKTAGQRFKHVDERGAYRLANLFVPTSESHKQFDWRGVVPLQGLTWMYPVEHLDELDKLGKIHWPSNDGLPKLKRYLDEMAMPEISSVWDDISDAVPPTERLKFLKSRPPALMERIIQMGSNVGDLILDLFCGTGSTLIAAQASARKWLACDRSPEAYFLSLRRLEEKFGLHPNTNFQIGDQNLLEMKFPIVQRINKSILDKFTLNEPINDEETRYCEFKEVLGSRAVDSIKNTSDEYAVAFLNRGSGGKIYWGIRNVDRTVVGVHLSYKDRDELNRVVTEKLNNIRPAITPSAFELKLHQVYQVSKPITDLYVVELEIPVVSAKNLYYTGSNQAFIKTDGGKKELKGPQLEDEILRRHGLE